MSCSGWIPGAQGAEPRPGTAGASSLCVSDVGLMASEMLDVDLAQYYAAEIVQGGLVAASPVPVEEPPNWAAAPWDSRPSPPAGRYAARLARPAARGIEDLWVPRRPAPPPRLAIGGVGGVAEDPFAAAPGERRWGAAPGAAPRAADDGDVPAALRHLAALEAAVVGGAAGGQGPAAVALPELPTAAPPVRPPLTARARSVGHGHGPRTVGALVGAGARPSPRIAGCGARPTPAGGLHCAFGRGEPPLPSAPRAHGHYATSQWVGWEAERLRREAPKAFGASATVAFLTNNGPERMEPLGRALVSRAHLAM